MLGGDDAVERRCHALEIKERLDLDAVEYTVARISRPRLVRERLGNAVLYAQRVEAEVAQLPIDTALPHPPDSFLGRFLRVWTPDEVGDGEAQARLLDYLDVPVAEAVPEAEELEPVDQRVGEAHRGEPGPVGVGWPRSCGRPVPLAWVLARFVVVRFIQSVRRE